MSWLKDRWEEVTAQVKMGDNRTASTVRAARAKAAPATTRVNTNQPGWSVRKPQQSLTTQQRIDQSYGGGFSGIKNRVIDTFDANTEADRIKRFARTGLNENYEQQDAGLRKQRIESELKASEAKRDAGGYSNYAPTKAANTVMSGAIRSIHGIGQGMGGLVDLVTPGKGTNRLTDFTKDYGEVWDKKREHAGVNKTAYQLAQLPMTLYGYSVGDKAITGTAQLAAKGISAIPKVGAIVPKVAGAVDTISKSKPVVAAATKLDDIALNGTRAQRVGAKLAQSYTKPGTMGNITALNTLQNAGERSSRGQDNNWGTFATDIATGLAMQGGLNLAGQAGAGVVRGVNNRIIEPTTNLVQRGKSELATGLNTLNRGANQHTPYTQLVPTEGGRQIVSPRDSGRVIRENLDEISEKTRARIQAAREKVPERFKLNKYGGSNADFDSPTIRNDLTGEVIPNPAYRGKNVDPLESLKQEARTVEKYPGLVDEILNAPNARVASQLAEQRGIWLELSDPVLNVMKNDRNTALDIINNSKPKGDYVKKIQQPLVKKIQEAQAEMDKYGTGYINDIDRAAEQAKAKARLDQAKDALFQNSESKLRSGKAMSIDPLESLKQEARQPANAFQDTLPSKSRPASIRELVKRGGNPLYHDTNASGVLGILDSGEIRASQAPFSQIAGQGKRVSTTRNFDNYSRYGKSPYRFVIDETKTGQKAIPDNREEFESIFKNNVKTDSVETLAIDITNPEIINDMNNGRLAEVIAKAKEKGIRVETFEGKILPDEYANKEIQQLTKDRFTKEFGKATQPPKSTPVQKVDPLESLKQEARKYKSGDEFDGNLYRSNRDITEQLKQIYPNEQYGTAIDRLVKGDYPKVPKDYTKPQKVYHGTDAEFDSFDGSKMDVDGHTYYSDSKDTAETYGKNIKEAEYTPKNPLVIDADGMGWNDIKYKGESYTTRELAQLAEKEGYGSVIFENVRDTGVRTSELDKPAGFETSTVIVDISPTKPTQPQPPKSTPKAVEAKPPTPFEQNLQTAGLAPQPTKGAIPERVQKVADTKLRSGTQEMPNQQTAKSQAALKQPSAADRRSLKISDQANQTQRSSQPQSQSPVSKLIEGSFDDNSTTKQIKVKGKISDADYRARYGKDRAPEKVKIKPFKTEDYAFEAWKDKGALGLNRETLERNLDRVAGSDAPKVKKFLVDASRNNESNRADFLKDVRGRIRKDVVEGLGIRAKSKESDLVQKYGEGIINDKQLADMAGNKADSVKKAADYFRKEYDSLLDQWNKQRRIHGLDEVPKRSDYFRHFQEISDGISQVGVILNRSELPTSIAGITDIFKPNKPFSNAELRRMGNKTTFDAVSGMDDYLDSVSRQIFHTDTVQRGRSIENAIRKQADENNKIELPNFVANLGEWTNIVSGKKTRVDRAAEALVGRKIYGFTNWARKRTGANMVGANLSSAMSNFIPFTQSLSTTDKRAAVKGLMTSLSSALKGNKNAIDGVKSSFLNRRFMDEAIDARGIRKASEIASTPFRLVDEFTSRAIVAGKYFEGKAKGLLPVDAMKQADDYAAKTLADRSIGQTPNLFNSQTMGLFTQFQLEVNNQLSFLARDIPVFANGNKAKIASSLTQFAVFSYLFNTAYEEVTGRRPQIDPIQAALDIKGDSDEDSTPYERLGKASERITTGIPGAGIVTDGGRLPINSMMPDFSALGKAASNVAKGDGAVLGQVYKGVSGPLFYGLPPFGGGQLRKTAEGVYAALQGESKTPAGKKRFDIQQDPLNVAKAATFGQYATQEGKEYISKLSDSESGIKKSGSSSISSDVDSVLKAQFSTKEQRAWLATSATDKKEAAKQDPEKAKWLKQYEATKRVNKNAPERPEGLSKESETILNWHNKRTPQQREKLAYTQNDYDYKLATAQFEEAKLNGTVSRAEMINKQQALAKAKVGKDFTKDTRESYNSLSKAELTTLAENDPNGKQIMADAIAYGDALVKAGLIKKNKLRTGSGSGGRRGGRGGKGRASKFDYTKNLFDSGSDSASTSKQLRAILQKAMSGKS